MKQKLLLLLLLAALGAGGYVYVNEKMLFTEAPPVATKKKVSKKTATPETKKPALSRLPAIFPSKPVIWIHLKDLGKIIRQVKKSNFYKQAVEYKFLDPSKPFSISLKTTPGEKNIFSKISSQLEEKTLMGFLGQEIGLAFYPPDKEGTSNYLFAAKISPIIKIQEKLQRAKDSLFGKQVIVSENNYKEKIIITYKNQGGKYSFNYVIIEDYLLGSSSDILLKKGIDTMEGKESDRFINSGEFNSLFKTSDLSLNGLFFTDIEEITQKISGNLIPSKNVPPKMVNDIKKLLQPFKSSGLTFKIQNGLEIKTTVTINKEKAGKEWLQAIKMEPRKLKSLNFIPGNAVISGVIVFEPSYSFEQIIKKVEEKEGTKKTFEKFFNKYTGVNPGKDIIPFIGNEIFYNVSVQDKTTPSRIPGITIGLEITDREKIKNLLNKIQTNMAKSSKQKLRRGESYEGYDINFIPISLPVPAQPVYSIIDNFLFLSSSQKEIRRLIDVSKKKIPPLEKNKKYVSAKIPAKNLGMLFINASPLWDGLSEAIVTAPASFSSVKSEKLAEGGIKSLDLMRTIQSFNSVFTRENDQFNSKTFIALKDIPKIRPNKKLLAYLEKSKQKTVPAKAITASHGYVYDPTGKRDPFQSLITGQTKERKLVQFFESIKGLEPINLYIYNKIRKKDRALYKKLKSHARFFKNKKALEQISQEKRLQKLEQYKHLISIAKSDFHDTILGPLQNSQYPSLKLTGIIWGGLESTALIETMNGKGFSVEVNDLIGPNYGVVKKIEEDKLVVVEKYVSYTGEITEKRHEINLVKGDEPI